MNSAGHFTVLPPVSLTKNVRAELAGTVLISCRPAKATSLGLSISIGKSRRSEIQLYSPDDGLEFLEAVQDHRQGLVDHDKVKHMSFAQRTSASNLVVSERLRSTLILLAVVASVVALYMLRRVVLLIYVSIIFAVIFTPIVGYIQRIRIRKWSPGKGMSILILLLVLAVAISLFFLLALPPIINDSRGLAADLPFRISRLQSKVRGLPFGNAIADKLQPAYLGQYAGKLTQSVFAAFQGVAGGLKALLTVALMTAYFILDGSRGFQWILSMVPSQQRGRLDQTFRRAAARAQRWLLGQALLMLILGSSSALVLGLLGINYSYALALFAGLANFVPVLGPIVTVILAGSVALLDSVKKLIGVLIFYAIYQQVENAFLTPRIMKSSVQLSPVAVVVALAIGGEAAGIVGAMIAVPTAAIVSTLADEYLVRDDIDQPTQLRAA